MQREKKLAKNTFILAIGTLLPRLTTFITLPILTGYLAQEEYGNYDLITVLVSLYLPAVTLQIQTAAFRYLIDVRDEEKAIKKIISNIFVFVITISLLALCILFIFLGKFDLRLRILICCYYLVDILNNTILQVTRGLAKNTEYSISAVIHSIAQMIFTFLFVGIYKIGIYGAVFSLLLSSLIALFYLAYKTRIIRYFDLSYISKVEIKELLYYSWPMVPNNMSMWVMRVSDRFIVLQFLGARANAIYAVANKIPNILSLFQNTFTMAWQENASVFSKDKDIDTYYSSMFKFIYDFMAGALGILIAVTPVLFEILIRGDYSKAYIQMPILFLGMFFSCMASYIGGIYVACKATKSVGITTSLAAVCNVIVDLLMIKWAGLYAASISTLVSYIILFVYRLIDVQKLVSLKFNIKRMIIIIIFLLLECYFCSKQITVLNIINIILAVVVFVTFNYSFIKVVFKQLCISIKNKVHRE